MTSRTANATPVPTSAIVRPRMPRASSGRGRGSAPASPEPSSLDMPGCCHGRRCPPRGPTRGSGGWPGASQPPAPTDPGVTVSRHRALLTSRSERTNPSPMGEQAGFSLEEPGPPPLEPLVGPQPPVLLPSPAPQAEADASDEGIHLRPVVPAVVVHPPGDDGVQPSRQVVQRLGGAPVNPQSAVPVACGLERLG